ncbi:ATP-binding protein [Chondromyces crocatus]|uniref:histidine kinase n=1 Tax=Chondromyces crocatus TaxID=52 RepID=A0A0K1EAS6_CHOCO|nr:ATP-binding protein [Chondromyces crocatus]AKT37959.1 uncharacterized protein CMC5_021000 [Chondromyces crocatus]
MPDASTLPLALFEAARTISSELVPERLRALLTRILVQHAGAERGVLLAAGDDQGDLLSFVIAEGASARRGGASPRGLVALTERRGQWVVFADAVREQAFALDPYFSEHPARSVLCMPLEYGGQVRAVIYLEHTQAEGVFSSERIDALSVLCAQGALALHNAARYDDLGRSAMVRARELEEVHGRLVDMAHREGMAEVATVVLHNVGNALTGVNLAAQLLADRIDLMPVDRLQKSVELMTENGRDLGRFFQDDERGRLLLTFLPKLADRLGRDRAELLGGVETLLGNVEQINAIVAAQQTYAHSPRMVEEVELNELVEEALRMHGAALQRHGIEVSRAISRVPAAPLERHRVLQILVNLVSNAKDALVNSKAEPRRIRVAASLCGPDRARVVVEDNGIGLERETMSQVFQLGYSTKAGSRGLGLHWAEGAASAMGGSLSVRSDGAGQGATFTLELPVSLGGEQEHGTAERVG